MKKKYVIVTLVAILMAVPVFAVFSEKDFAQTLSVLRFELNRENQRITNLRSNLKDRNMSQHAQMVQLMKKCNELALVLYSQSQDYTFDMTYALDEVTRQYEDFNRSRMPYDDFVTRLSIEVERYERLVEALRRLPPALDQIEEVPDSISISTDSLIIMLQADLDPHDHDHHDHDHLRYETAEEAAEHHHEPYLLDEKGQEDRDSSLFYARNLLRMYTEARNEIVDDNEHYEEASRRLKETYDYAQNRYRMVQKKIFTKQDTYFKILKRFGRYYRMALRDVHEKYDRVRMDVVGGELVNSEWRGPAVSGFVFFIAIHLILASLLCLLVIQLLKRTIRQLRTAEFRRKTIPVTIFFSIVVFALSIMVASHYVTNNFFAVASKLLLTFSWITAVIILSALVRLDGKSLRYAMRIYAPVIVLGFIVVMMRVLFIPNRMINLIFPLLLLLFFLWQYLVCRKASSKVMQSDRIFGWISMVVIGIAAIMAWAGYVLMSLQVFIWWIFQLACIQTVTAIYDLLSLYSKKILSDKLKEYKSRHKMYIAENVSGAFIEVTWFFDLITMALVPVLAIGSIPFAIWLAAGIFDLSEMCSTIFFHPFLNLSNAAGEVYLHLSLFKIVLVASLYFIFRYVSYLIKSLYRHMKYVKLSKSRGYARVRTNEVNLTLANNVVEILVWGIYIVTSILLLKIPMGAISIVAAGLATGLGLALKDVLNNFIYGIQLMSGRLRVGDWIECDGVRGKVERISYQSTDIETIDGAIMAFTNTSLFNENFKNLTKNNSYEFVKIVVGVSYGTDVEKVRELIVDALQQLQVKDGYGRDVVDLKKGVTVVFDEFDESSVNLAVKQFVIVSEKVAYIAQAKEIIYNTLNANGIEIPFPQRDVNIKVNPDNNQIK